MARPTPRLLTLPDTPSLSLSFRARAMLIEDPRAVALLAHVETLARSGATVLMLGEGGTGKELLARHMHRVDQEANGRSGPFVAATCGGLGEARIDAQLFGGPGWLAAARGGTLFLDGIGALTVAQQGRLLGVLEQEGAATRLVAATSIDLHKVVEGHQFRADLLDRLSPALVALPPLRERALDILPLARHFAGVYAEKLGLGPVRLAPETEAALLGYLWPGNIRELENVIHFALVVCADGVVRPEDLELVPGGSLPPAAKPHPAEALYALVRATFEASGADARKAAGALGIPLASLAPLLDQYGLAAALPGRADGPTTRAPASAAH